MHLPSAVLSNQNYFQNPIFTEMIFCEICISLIHVMLICHAMLIKVGYLYRLTIKILVVSFVLFFQSVQKSGVGKEQNEAHCKTKSDITVC